MHWLVLQEAWGSVFGLDLSHDEFSLYNVQHAEGGGLPLRNGCQLQCCWQRVYPVNYTSVKGK